MSAQPLEVIINGARYVRATDAVPTIDTIMQALYESYMGEGKHWNDDPLTGGLYVGEVNEDGDGDSFEDFAARIAEISGRIREGNTE